MALLVGFGLLGPPHQAVLQAARVKVKPKVKPKIKAKVKTKVKAKPKAKAKVKAKPKAKAKPKPKAKTKATTKPKAKVKASATATGKAADIGPKPTGRPSTWTRSDGTVVQKFRDGTKVEISPKGVRTKTLPDGKIYRSSPDGTKSLTYPDGRRVVRTPDGKAKVYKNGQVSDGLKKTTTPEGKPKASADPNKVATLEPPGGTKAKAKGKAGPVADGGTGKVHSPGELVSKNGPAAKAVEPALGAGERIHSVKSARVTLADGRTVNVEVPRGQNINTVVKQQFGNAKVVKLDGVQYRAIGPDGAIRDLPRVIPGESGGYRIRPGKYATGPGSRAATTGAARASTDAAGDAVVDATTGAATKSGRMKGLIKMGLVGAGAYGLGRVQSGGAFDSSSGASGGTVHDGASGYGDGTGSGTGTGPASDTTLGSGAVHTDGSGTVDEVPTMDGLISGGGDGSGFSESAIGKRPTRYRIRGRDDFEN